MAWGGREVQFGACGIVYFQKWVLGFGGLRPVPFVSWEATGIEGGGASSLLPPHALGCGGGDWMFRGYLSTCVYMSVSVVRVRVHVCVCVRPNTLSPGRVYRLAGLFVFAV